MGQAQNCVEGNHTTAYCLDPEKRIKRLGNSSMSYLLDFMKGKEYDNIQGENNIYVRISIYMFITMQRKHSNLYSNLPDKGL